jgi:hypothetical protein
LTPGALPPVGRFAVPAMLRMSGLQERPDYKSGSEGAGAQVLS